MKNLIIGVLVVAFSIQGISQNNQPQIVIQNVSIDQVVQEVSITYDLLDADNDICEIWLKVSGNGGDFFEVIDNTNTSGSVGPLLPSVNNVLNWDYSAFNSTIFNTQIKLVASDGHTFDIQDFVDEVDSTEIKTSLNYIEGIRHFSANPTKLNEVRDSIDNKFVQYGLETERQAFAYSGNQGYNIVGKKRGLKDEAITFIIDGHYDGVSNSPSADDNGSAVAGMLEIARVLSQYDFEHTIRFIGFDYEESGLIGSQRYVLNNIEPYEDIQGVLNFEMIGYYSDQPNSQIIPNGFDVLFPQAVQEIQNDDERGNFLIVCGNTNSTSLISDFLSYSATYVPALRVISLEVPGNGEIAPDLRRSDHTPFWEADYKALMLTDGADTRNLNYHTIADTIGNLNFDFMTNNVKAVLATIAELAIPVSAGSDSYDLAVLSIDNHHNHGNLDITIYPNPSDGQVSVKISSQSLSRLRMEVYDLQGKVVYNEIINSSEETFEETINLSHLKSGKYIAVCISDEGRVSRSLIIK